MASAAAASEMLGSPVAVLDFGTATTVNFIGQEAGSGEAVFRGGAIMPGLRMMLNCLAGETAGLPLVELKHGARSPGRDTGEGILSGVVLGTAGAVEKVVRAAEEHEEEPYKVAVTGGLMGYVLPFLWRVDLEEPHLTLMGLKLIYERNG
jgi:type III pantothenate kinase